MKQLDLIPTGQIVNTHGLRGDVKVMPWADDPDELLDYERFFIDGREYRVQHSSRQKTKRMDTNDKTE